MYIVEHLPDHLHPDHLADHLRSQFKHLHSQLTIFSTARLTTHNSPPLQGSSPSDGFHGLRDHQQALSTQALEYHSLWPFPGTLLLAWLVIFSISKPTFGHKQLPITRSTGWNAHWVVGWEFSDKRIFWRSLCKVRRLDHLRLPFLEWGELLPSSRCTDARKGRFLWCTEVFRFFLYFFLRCTGVSREVYLFINAL